MAEPQRMTSNFPFGIENLSSDAVVEQASQGFSPYYRGLLSTAYSDAYKDHTRVTKANNPRFNVRNQACDTESISNAFNIDSANPRWFLGIIRQGQSGRYMGVRLSRGSFATAEEAVLAFDNEAAPAQDAALAFDEAVPVVEDTQTRTNAHFSSSDEQPLRENTVASSTNLDNELVIDVNMDCGEARTVYYRSTLPQLCIDYWKESHQAWQEHINQLKKSRLDNEWMMMMSDTSLALAGQAIGAVMANALTSSSTSPNSSSTRAVYLVEFALVLGLSFTLAGIRLRGKRRAPSILMTKLGAIATASAILISLGSRLPPLVAWTVGPFAFFIMAAAVASP